MRCRAPAQHGQQWFANLLQSAPLTSVGGRKASTASAASAAGQLLVVGAAFLLFKAVSRRPRAASWLPEKLARKR